MHEHTGTFRGMRVNAGACRENWGIQWNTGKTGEYIKIWGNTEEYRGIQDTKRCVPNGN